MSAFIDGNRVTPGAQACVCGPECEFPCWQRLGFDGTAVLCGLLERSTRGGDGCRGWDR